MPEADRLLKLSVDVGKRHQDRLCLELENFSGARKVGWNAVSLLTNLETRVIRGLESQGMILAGSEERVFSLLNPSNPLPPGTLIK